MKLDWTRNNALGDYHAKHDMRNVRVSKGEISRNWYCEILGPVSTYRFRNGWRTAGKAKEHAERAMDMLIELEKEA